MKLGILPCQGACNVGNMTNKVALNFVENDKVNMVCSLGLPLGIQKIVDMAMLNDKFIALNGCPVKCASKTLQSVGINNYDELTLTNDFGIDKNKNFADETKMGDVETKVKGMIDDFFKDERK